MGCCESCFGKEENGEPNERTSLLSGSGNVLAVNSTDPVNTPYEFSDSPIQSVAKSKNDEQSILNRVLSQYENEVIDITALDQKIDAVEYMNRVQLYSRRVANLNNGIRHRTKPTGLLSATNTPASLLSTPPVSVDDILLITKAAGDMRLSMNNIKVNNPDELVLSLAHR